MSLLDLCISVIVQLSQQQVMHKMYRDNGYIFTIKMNNEDRSVTKFAHIIVVSPPSVYILVNDTANWREIPMEEFTENAVNTSNHDECWKSSGFTLLESLWDTSDFTEARFWTGNFGFNLYESVYIGKKSNDSNQYKLTSVQAY